MGNSKSKKPPKAMKRKMELEAGVRDSQFSMGLDNSRRGLGQSWKEISVDNFNESGEDITLQKTNPRLKKTPLRKQETTEYEDLPPPPKAKPQVDPKELKKVSGELEVFLLKVDPGSLSEVTQILETFKLEGRQGLNGLLLDKYGQNLDQTAAPRKVSIPQQKPTVPARLKVANPAPNGLKPVPKPRRPSAMAFQQVAQMETTRVTNEQERDLSGLDNESDGERSDEESDGEDLNFRKKSSIVPPFAEKPREFSVPEFMQPSSNAVRKGSQTSAHTGARKNSQVSNHSRQHSVMSGQSENIGEEGEDGRKNGRKPTKFAQAILPANVLAEFAQKGNQKPRDVSELERKVSVQKQRKLSYMSQESANIESGQGSELQQKLAKARKMSMRPPTED